MRKWLNGFALLVTLLMNALANFLRLGGNTTGEVAERYLNLYTPAGITFAIWGLIYLLMIVFVVRQWSDAFLRERVGWLFAASCVLNTLWLLAWHFEWLGVSVLLIAALLWTLVRIELRLGGACRGAAARTISCIGFDIYCGWVIAASIGCIATWLTQIGWNGFGLPESVWTVIVLVLGALIATAFVLQQDRPFVGAGVIWAYLGVLLRQLSPEGFAGRYPAVVVTAAAGITAIAVTILAVLLAPYLPTPKRARS